jgi:transketolase
VIEDHGTVGALGDHLGRALICHDLLEGRQYEVIGVEGLPACGTPAEALNAHGLDAMSLAVRFAELVRNQKTLAGIPSAGSGRL